MMQTTNNKQQTTNNMSLLPEVDKEMEKCLALINAECEKVDNAIIAHDNLVDSKIRDLYDEKDTLLIELKEAATENEGLSLIIDDQKDKMSNLRLDNKRLAQQVEDAERRILELKTK